METPDLIDQLMLDWAQELPDIDTSGMSVVGRIIYLGRILESKVEATLKPLGLIYTDFDILATLRRSGQPYCLSPTELRQSVLITSGAMTAAMKRLEKLGLLERRKDIEDGRSSKACLTQKGAKLAAEAARVRFEHARQSVTDLNDAEILAAATVLRKLSHNLNGQAF